MGGILRKRRLLPIVMVVITIAVLFARRPDQFLHPYIWVEEGSYTLREFVDGGARTLIAPLAGYEVLASKLIAYIAFRTSILWAPQIDLVLVVALTCGVVLAVAFAPTHLRSPALCAVSLLLIPSDAEVFAVSSYAFWWAGLLLLLAVLWDTKRGLEWLRWVFIAFGGLSSPLIGAAWGLLGLRAVVERTRSEFIALGLATVVLAAQVAAMRQQQLKVFPDFEPRTVVAIITKFIGGFFTPDGSLVIGLAVCAALALVAWRCRDRLDRYFLLLVAMFGIVCVAVTMRQPIATFSGFNAFNIAPRYFFYPFILLGWIAIWLASVATRPVQIAVGAAFILSIALAGRALSRRHEGVDWKAEVTACAHADKYELPFHYIGIAKDMWHTTFAGKECRDLIAQSVF
jgi:hypothetical protein